MKKFENPVESKEMPSNMQPSKPITRDRSSPPAARLLLGGRVPDRPRSMLLMDLPGEYTTTNYWGSRYWHLVERIVIFYQLK